MTEVGRKYVFDFDSTLTRVEALDVLAEMTLQGKSNREDVIHEIQEITNLGIDGDISFTESLENRRAALAKFRTMIQPPPEETTGALETYPPNDPNAAEPISNNTSFQAPTHYPGPDRKGGVRIINRLLTCAAWSCMIISKPRP